MKVVITGGNAFKQSRSRNYGLAGLSGKRARSLMSKSLNKGGDKARTQVKRSLVTETGIKYGLINKAVRTERASPGNLVYSLVAEGTETNLNLFGARQGKKGVSAAPWRKRRVFKSTFIVRGYKGRVYARTSKERGPLEALFGPNIAREIVKPPTINHWDKATDYVFDEVDRLLLSMFKF